MCKRNMKKHVSRGSECPTCRPKLWKAGHVPPVKSIQKLSQALGLFCCRLSQRGLKLVKISENFMEFSFVPQLR